MEILFIVCPYVTRHRLGSFPHCWTTFDHRCCFPSDSVPICLPLSLSVCFCPVRPPPPFSVNSLCSQVRLSGHPLPPLSVKQPVFSAFGCLVAPFRRFLLTACVLSARLSGRPLPPLSSVSVHRPCSLFPLWQCYLHHATSTCVAFHLPAPPFAVCFHPVRPPPGFCFLSVGPSL